MSAFDDYQRQREQKKKAAHELASAQDKSNRAPWEAIGSFIGDAGKNVGNFFADANRNAEDARRSSGRSPSKVGFSAPKTATSPTNNNSSRPSDSSMADMVSRNTEAPHYANKMLSDDAAYGSHMAQPPMDPREKLFNDLLGKIGGEWNGPDKSKIDYSPLDAALNARMGVLNSVREKSQQNFDKSDMNLESMYRGHQNNITTEGAKSYNGIADTQKANLNADNAAAQANIQGIKDQDSAKRVAMLHNLGLEESAGSHDVSADPLNQAIGSIASRNDANVTNAEADRGTNLAFNQSVATSVGQQGVERRGDLAQQLQQILGKVDMAGADAQSENTKARYQLEQGSGDRQYQQWRDQQGMYGDQLHQMEKDAMDQQKLNRTAAKPASISGFAGIPQDLRNSGYDDSEIQGAMGAISDLNSNPDYLSASNSMQGNDKVALITGKLSKPPYNIRPALAFQLATNYAKLGSTSKYTDTPY